MILSFADNLKSCNTHISSVDDGDPFYRKETEYLIKEAKDKIKKVLQEAYNNEVITTTKNLSNRS